MSKMLRPEVVDAISEYIENQSDIDWENVVVLVPLKNDTDDFKSTLIVEYQEVDNQLISIATDHPPRGEYHGSVFSRVGIQDAIRRYNELRDTIGDDTYHDFQEVMIEDE